MIMLSGNSIKMSVRQKLKKPKKQKVPHSHTYMFTCVAKISAFRKVGKLADAREWAVKLQEHLRQEGMLP
jgi:hypothetical protein